MMPLALTSRFGLIGGALAGIVLSGAAAGQTPTPQCLNDEQVLGSDTVEKDYFGTGVAIDGRFAIVGAVFHGTDGVFRAGAAYIYERDGDDWNEIQKIWAEFPSPGPEEEGFFGEGVDIDGDLAIVASPGFDGDLGGVFVFHRNANEPVGDQWEQEALLTASDGTNVDDFGGGLGAHQAVSIDTNLIVVGAPGAYVNDDPHVGKAYIFRYDGQGWVEEAILTAGQYVEANANFGRSAAVSGRRVIIGAPGEGPGAAYIYERDTTLGQWNLEQRITAPQPVASGQFGLSVSIDGGRAIVGEPWADRAHIFSFIGSTWTHVDDLDAAGGDPGDDFGLSVSISGSLAVVGAWSADHPDPAIGSTGAAYVFQHQPGGWVEVLELFPAVPFAEDSDRFGEVVTVYSDQVLIGSPGAQPPEAGPGEIQHGAAYFFPAVPGCAFD